MQLVFKVGTKYPEQPHRGWRDGQLVEIFPDGHRLGDRARKGFCVVQTQHDYWGLRGSTDRKSKIAKAVEFRKWTHVPDANGKYSWEDEYIYGKYRTRDWFLDYKKLLDLGWINKADFDSIYDKSRDHNLIYVDRDLTSYLVHEDEKVRLSHEYDTQKGSVAAGTFEIGTGGGAVYATVTLFAADIAATLTGDLTGEHQDEETVITTAVTFDFDTVTHLFKLTAKSGAEHTGGAYGSGARINYENGDQLTFDETNPGDLDNIEVSNLALDVRGANIGIHLLDCSDSGLVTINRVLGYGDADTRELIRLTANCTNSQITNNIAHSMGFRGGIFIENIGSGDTHYIANNTCIGCKDNFIQASASMAGTLTFKNNLAQGGTNSDYLDAGGGFGTTSKNVSEDATSPDAAYRSKDVHTNSVFQNYVANDYRLDPAGDVTNLAILDDGDDLSGTFTDDIEGQTRSTWYIGASEIVAVGWTHKWNTIAAANMAKINTVPKANIANIDGV